MEDLKAARVIVAFRESEDVHYLNVAWKDGSGEVVDGLGILIDRQVHG